MNIRKSIEIINRCEIKDLDYGIINDRPFSVPVAWVSTPM